MKIVTEQLVLLINIWSHYDTVFLKDMDVIKLKSYKKKKDFKNFVLIQ